MGEAVGVIALMLAFILNTIITQEAKNKHRLPIEITELHQVVISINFKCT
jgi:hypothetical protein